VAINLGPNPARAATPVKAIAFDGFVIFDPKSIAVLAENRAIGWRSFLSPQLSPVEELS
jgi:hypothetical protein